MKKEKIKQAMPNNAISDDALEGVSGGCSCEYLKCPMCGGDNLVVNYEYKDVHDGVNWIIQQCTCNSCAQYHNLFTRGTKGDPRRGNYVYVKEMWCSDPWNYA